MEDCLKIVVTGEVDAGKSSLIGSFLHAAGAVTEEAIREIESASRRLGHDREYAYLLDSFEEERTGQLTIDTTRIFCRNGAGPDILFIDVPGHAELLKNMLTGSSDADAALLVIDIRKVIEEGTRRHIRALDFLGVRRITVVLNKLDAVGYSQKEFRRARETVAGYFRRGGFRAGPAIPVSARCGDNLVRRSAAMPWYRGRTLQQVLSGLRVSGRAVAGRKLCFPVQDVYPVDGRPVCVGTLVSGAVRAGDVVRVAPSGVRCRVKRLHVFGERAARAAAGDPVGLELSGVAGIRRGDVIYTGRAPVAGRRFRARIFCVRSINTGEPLTLQCATQSVVARILRLVRVLENSPRGCEGIVGSSSAEVVIGTDSPVVTGDPGRGGPLGRFVLRDDAGICAAGIVI